MQTGTSVNRAAIRRPVEASGTFAIGELRVHRLGFGAMRLTGPGVWGPPADHAEAIRVLRRAIELGVDLIDTANSYGRGPRTKSGRPLAAPSTSGKNAR